VGLDQPGPLGLIHRQQNETSDNHPNRATAAALQIKKSAVLSVPLPGSKSPIPQILLATRVSIFFYQKFHFCSKVAKNLLLLLQSSRKQFAQEIKEKAWPRRDLIRDLARDIVAKNMLL
jgi:hypothetical protein